MFRSLVRSSACSLVLAACLAAAVAAPASAQVRYPESRVAPVTDTLHGVAITDNYRWLEDQPSADTRGWIAAQNRFREQAMAGLG